MLEGGAAEIIAMLGRGADRWEIPRRMGYATKCRLCGRPMVMMASRERWGIAW